VEFIARGNHGQTNTLTNAEGRSVSLVCIKPGLKGAALAEISCHEAVHVWQEVREKIGEEKPSREFEAYCIGAIAAEIFMRAARK
jgi:hypothetical protein